MSDTMSPRIERLRKRLVETTPVLVSDRVRLVTESYQATHGLPALLRRAKAFHKVMSECEQTIWDEELLVGSFSGEYRGCQLYPEYDLSAVIKELDDVAGRQTERFLVSEKTKAELREAYEYWKGNSLSDVAWSLIPEDCKESAASGFFLLTVLRGGVGHIIVDYESCLRKGVRGLLQEVAGYRAALNPENPEYGKKMLYYQAVEICLDGFVIFARRLAEQAELLAAKAEGKRHDELLRAAAVCRRVPELPAESFSEAVQSFWLLHVCLHYESSGHSYSPGRFDQYVFPYYEKDLAAGTLSREEAEEILQALWLKFNEANKFRDKASSVAYSGGSMFQNLNTGGMDRRGKSAVNELSHLCLDVTATVQVPQPSLSARWFHGIEEDYLQHVIELASRGTGHPAIFNDEVLVPNLMLMGYNLNESREYGVVGCTEFTGHGNVEPWLTGGFFNVLKGIELAVFDGYDPLQKKQLVFRTGPVEEMATFAEFFDAYVKQVDHYLAQEISCNNILETVHAELCETPFESVFVQGCLANAKGNLSGGARYNSATLEMVGAPNAVDALAAVDTLIYREKRLTWAELKEALLNNYEGCEHIQGLLLNHVPKYGNDDEYVDAVGSAFVDRMFELIEQYRTTRGSKYRMAIYSVSSHILFAPHTGATPDGRKNGEILADGGISCGQGRDKEGPTALLNTIVKMDPSKILGSALLNVKLAPELMRTEEGRRRVADMVKAYFLNKGQHIQFNVLDVAALREAQRHPENYPLLMVRVAGFSVYFNTVSSEVQEDIISRTEHSSRRVAS